MHSDVVCGLDIGASCVRTVIAQALEPGYKEKVLGFAELPTKGFSKGVVTNLSLLSDTIEDVVLKAEELAHQRIRKVVTNIYGVHIRTFKSRGSIHISDRPSEITKEDIKRCIESAKLIAMSLDREVIHLIPEQFYIDDKMKIDDPLGLFGSKLDLDLNIVTSLVSSLQNVTKAINLAGYEAEDIIISGAGTALAVFEYKHMEEGAVVIDVGKDLTEVALFMNGKLRDCFYFPFGSDDFTAVLQDKLKIMFEEAEELRVKYGIVTKDNKEVYDNSEIPLYSLRNRPGSGSTFAQFRETRGENWADNDEKDSGARSQNIRKGVSVISRQEISNILFPKVEEFMLEVYKKIEPFLKERKKVPSISIVGGISKMDGFVDTTEEIFGVPVHMGRICNTKEFRNIDFACSLGLTRYEARKKISKKPRHSVQANSLIGKGIAKVQSLLSEYF